MSLFFFHFLRGGERDDDEIGVELPSVEAAYLEAVASARSMASELLTNGIDASRCAFEIADASGNLLLSIEFSELLDRQASRPVPDHGTVRLSATLEDTHRRAQHARQGIASSLREVRASLDESYQLLERFRRWERGGARLG